MFRTKNHITACAVICLFLFVGSIGCSSPKAKKDTFYKKGQELLEKADYVKAKLEFKNALQIDQKFDKAYYGLAYCEFKLNEFKKAFSFANKAIELNPGYIDAHLLLGRIYLLAREWDKVREKADLILDKEPLHVDALLLKATLSVVNEKHQEAEEILKKIIALDDHKTEAYLQLALIYDYQNKQGKAEGILQEGIAKNAKNETLPRALGDFYIKEGKLDAAEEIYKKHDDKPRLARFYVEITKSIDKGIDVLEKLIKEKPEKAEYRIQLARVYAVTGDDAKAEEILLAGIKEVSPGFQIRLALAEFYKAKKKPEKAIELMKETIALEPESAEAVSISTELAQVYLDQNNPALASEILNHVIEKNPKDFKARFLRGEMCLDDNKGLDAIGEFNYCIDQEPNYAPAYDRLARAHLANNDERLAKDYFKKAFSLDPTLYPSLETLLNIYEKEGKLNEGVAEIKDAAARDPNNIYLLGRLGDAYLRTQDFKNAEQTFNKLIARYPNNPIGHHRLGLLYMRENKNDKAKEGFRKSLDADPGFYASLEGLANILIKEQRLDAALSLCIDNLKDLPNDGPVHLVNNLIGHIHVLKRNKGSAMDAFKQAIKAKPDWIDPYSSLIDLYFIDKRHDEGLAYFAGLKEIYPQEPLPDYARGMIYLKLSDYEKAKAAFKEILEERPGHFFAANNLAYLYAEYFPTEKNLEKARQMASKILEQHPDQYNTLDTLGWIYCKQGEYKKGIDLYEKMGSRRIENPVYAYHLGVCHLKNGDKENASIYLKKAADASMDFKEAREARKELERLSLKD